MEMYLNAMDSEFTWFFSLTKETQNVLKLEFLSLDTTVITYVQFIKQKYEYYLKKRKT